MGMTVVFGGAFDPPHTEHEKLLRAAVKSLRADRAVVAPTYCPPHKNSGHLDFSHRAELAKLAFASVENDGAELVVDDIELRRGEDNYAALVLPELKEKYGNIVYLIGSDSLDYLEQWYRPDVLLSVCPIAVAGRCDEKDEEECLARMKKKTDELKNAYGGEFMILDFFGRQISSTQIKCELMLGEKCEGICDAVRRYISDHALFEEYLPMIDRLRGFESDELFAHSKAVVKTALALNSAHRLRQDPDEVFQAALLHDNAKQRPSVDGLPIPEDAVGTPVAHQFLGAEKARRDFGVTDENILSAIRYHTTAKAGMSTFEKLIYTADSTSEDRQYEPIPRLRELVFSDFEEGFRAVLKYTYNKLLERGKGIYPLTVEAYKYYFE